MTRDWWDDLVDEYWAWDKYAEAPDADRSISAVVDDTIDRVVDMCARICQQSHAEGRSADDAASMIRSVFSGA